MSVIHDLADMLANQEAGSGRSPGKRLLVLSPTLRLFRSVSLRALLPWRLRAVLGPRRDAAREVGAVQRVKAAEP